ncbi:MAG: putative ABC transport system ATP-binding protein [Candidatus Binatia bacterium]|jgi:putative ABC transport system ATP-binding protein
MESPPNPSPTTAAHPRCFSGALIKRYDEKQIHADSFKLTLDVDIRASSTHGILGHSGSGKSTLLNVIAILDSPSPDTKDLKLNFSSAGKSNHTYEWSEGRWLHRNGSTSKTVSPDVIRRRHFGFVFQAGHLSPNLSAAQNVMFPLALANVDRGVAKAKAATLLTKVGLEPRLHRALPRNLSGGEYQRVAVARALSHDPDVVFADEPTGNLDPDAGVKVMNALQEWRQAAEGRTLILVTHNIDQALAYCDRLTILRGGNAVCAVNSNGRTSELAQAVPKDRQERELHRTLIEAALKPSPPAR